LDALAELFSQLQLWLFESVVQPLMFAAELGSRLEDGFSATGWLLVGCLQLLVMLLVIGPLQKWRPVEALTDRSAVRVDVLYTLIHRLGLFRVAMFFAFAGGWRCHFPSGWFVAWRERHTVGQLFVVPGGV
jgi:hypothetical protein